MKKILLLILTLFLFFACYIIYQVTDDDEINYVLIGDELVNNPYIIRNEVYKNDFVNNDYRIIDLLRIIKYNEEMLIDKKVVSIHQQLQEADILVVSIGTGEINSKLLGNTKDKYAYVNKFMYNLKDLFKYLNKYSYKQIFFLGYDYLDNNKRDIINYLNMNVKKITKDNNICFIDINKVVNKEEILIEKNGLFSINDDSYKKIYDFIVENLENC